MKMNIHATTMIYFLMIAGLLAGFSRTGEAETDKSLSPYFLIEKGDPEIDQFPLKSTEAQVTINGVIAEVVVTQRYRNEGNRPINAQYVFPASTRAAVHGMKMTIGDEVIIARVKERQAAQEAFNAAKRDGKSASLLNQDRPNVFTMNVANMMPGDTVEIELSYTELLIPEDNIYEFVYPTVVGPRYSGMLESEGQASDKWVKSPFFKPGDPSPTRFDMKLKMTCGIPIQDVVCPSHLTDINWIDEKTAEIELNRFETAGGDRDFILKYRLAGDTIESGLMLYKGEQENFFLMMVQPPDRTTLADIPRREYIFVVDVSGSMDGFPLDTAKILLKDLISNLRETDTFNVILFAGGSNSLSETSLPALPENIQKAVDLIDMQQGGGGTELLSAVNRALDLPRDERVSRSMVIVTDGYISMEKDVFEAINQNIDTTNVFSFGIGSSVNRYLIEGLAKAGHGEPFIITSLQEAPQKAAKFREYIELPILTNIKIDFEDFETYAVEPMGFSDLFAKRPLVIFGKWRGAPEGRIKISGFGGDGFYLQTFSVGDAKPDEQNHVLPYLWARKRIEAMSDDNFDQDTDEDLKGEIIRLGLQYNLLTRYTSFIAVHETIRNPDPESQDVKQPSPLPRNVSSLAVGGSMNSVPEPEISILVIFLIIVAWFISCRRLIKREDSFK